MDLENKLTEEDGHELYLAICDILLNDCPENEFIAQLKLNNIIRKSAKEELDEYINRQSTQRSCSEREDKEEN